MRFLKLLSLVLFLNDLHAQNDSVVRYWVYTDVTHSAEFETNNASYASTRAVYYLKDGRWQMESRFIPGGNLYMTGSYADPKGARKEGSFVTYYRNGKVASRVVYKDGKEEGVYETWHQNGRLKDSFLMRHGTIVGKGYEWNDDGTVLVVYDLDDEGSGTVKTIGNKTHFASEGRFEKGKMDGKWVYYADEGYKDWEVVYRMDSVVSSACFDASGKERQDCIFQKEAIPSGGAVAWNKYLVSSINKYGYPSKRLLKSGETLSGRVQVKFMVDKDGSIREVSVIQSLNSEADNIALSVVRAAPKWTPGIYKNRAVRSFHTQPFTFDVDLK